MAPSVSCSPEWSELNSHFFKQFLQLSTELGILDNAVFAVCAARIEDFSVPGCQVGCFYPPSLKVTSLPVTAVKS